jgi:hypothetical protein
LLFVHCIVAYGISHFSDPYSPRDYVVSLCRVLGPSV